VTTGPAGPASPPADFGLALDPDTRRPRPEVLVGGAPIRVLRLRAGGTERLDRWEHGEPIGGSPGAGALARRLLDAGMAHPRPPAGAGPSPAEVTVVIPVRDQRGGLATTLTGLGPAAAVVVVDDGSRTPIEWPGVGVIRGAVPAGPAAARNRGWRAAATDLIAFVDADIEPPAGWLAGLLPHFADPAVGAVAPRVRSRPGAATPPRLAAYEDRRSALDLGAREAAVRPGSPVPYVPTAALVVRRQAISDAAGFDEQLRYGEDVDLVWRLHRLGWRVRYQPEVTVTHPARDGYWPWVQQRYAYGRSATPLAIRHGRAVAPVAMSPWTAGAWGLAGAGHPLAAAAVVAAVTGALARRAGGDRATARTLAGLAVSGNVRAGPALAGAIRRAWLPPAVGAAWASARLGRRIPLLGLTAALGVPPLAEWVRSRPGVDLLTWFGLRLADDLAYQSGVWAGAIESRSAAALLPDW
jgi:mycofactocin system glycosyltransferase